MHKKFCKAARWQLVTLLINPSLRWLICRFAPRCQSFKQETWTFQMPKRIGWFCFTGRTSSPQPSSCRTSSDVSLVAFSRYSRMGPLTQLANAVYPRWWRRAILSPLSDLSVSHWDPSARLLTIQFT